MSNPSSQQPVAPFSASYSAQLPELLLSLNCSLVLSTYQAGKVVMLSPANENSITVLPRSFVKPMGIALDGDKMAIATKNEVIKLSNSKELAEYYPNQPGKYDDFYVPRATYYTGSVDLHDLHFGKDALWAVNTSFSCICKIDDTYSFTPVWQPHFITKLAHEDRCHLNGMVLQDGAPKYVTALGKEDTAQSWRGNIVSGGILMDVLSNKIIAEGLAMPHSPKVYKDELYMLLSASGEFIKVNTATGDREVIKKTDRFVRGLSIYKDYAFIGMSKLRKNSSTFAHLPFAEKAQQAGIMVIHLPTKAFVGEFIFQASVDEIYEVLVLPDCTKPNILNTINEVHTQSLVLPGSTFWSAKKEEK